MKNGTNTPLFRFSANPSLTDINLQQGAEIADMEELIRQLKEDFGKIRTKCEDLLEQGTSKPQSKNKQSASSRACSPGSKLNVKDSCQQLEAKIDKLSGFLTELSDRLWASPATSCINLLYTPAETSDDEGRSQGRGGVRFEESQMLKKVKSQLKAKERELDSVQGLLEKKDQVINELNEKLEDVKRSASCKNVFRYDC